MEDRTAARARWRRRHPGRDSGRGPNFPPELAELPSFGHWLRGAISDEVEAGVVVDPTAAALSRFPSRSARKYRSLYAYGFHYRVRSAETHFRTCDSGIAATFVRECRYGLRDPNPVIAPVEYVGHLEEIIELEYEEVRQVVLIGTWVRANYRGNAATVKKDQYGFTIANFERMLPFGRDSFAFPSQVEQVFYSDCAEAPGWKVIVRTEPRGRRVIATDDEEQGGLLFRHGRDSEYSGLQVPDQLSEEQVLLSEAGRVIRVTEDIGADLPEAADLSDHDLGDSSAEE